MRRFATAARALLFVPGLVVLSAVPARSSDPDSVGAARAAAPAPVLPPEPAPLLWPTNAGRCITGTFCEFRPDHFHSGIDISTNGRTGYRCLAVGDGEIVRVRVSCGGYGRSLYLKLADGRTAVYAHLSRFEDAAARAVRTHQEAAGSAYCDLSLSPGIPVEAGETVGYTGQSGAGVPHLHFEIRDHAERPLDPRTEGLFVDDTIPPAVTRVALTPLTFVSSVDGRSDTVILDVLPGDSPARGRLARAIPVEGEIGIAVEVDETIDECRYRLAPRRLELRTGDEVLYAVDYSGFAFSETGLMDLQIDPRFSYSKIGRFHNLWRRAGNDLPFSTGDWKADGVVRAGQIPAGEREPVLPAGGNAPRALLRFPWRDSVQRPEEKVRDLEIRVEDASGNAGSVEVRLSFAAPPQITVLTARLVRKLDAMENGDAGLEEAWSDSVAVDGAYHPGGRALRTIGFDYSLDQGKTWSRAPSALPDIDGSFHARFRVTRRVPGEGGRDVLVRARAVDVLGVAGLARTVATEGSVPPPPRSVEPEIVTLGSWFELRFPESVSWSALSGGWDDRGAVLVRPWGRGVRIVQAWSAGPAGRVPDARERSSVREVREWSGDGSEWKGYDPWGRPVPIRFEPPVGCGEPHSPTIPSRNWHGRVESPRGLAIYHLKSDGFREPLYARVREEPPPPPRGELRAVSPLHFLETGQVPVTGAYEVELRPDGAIAFDSNHLGIFVHEPAGFRYIGGQAREGGGWVTETRTFLGIGLFEDVTPPVVGDARLEVLHDRICLAFRADDQGAGIDCDDVEVLFEGIPIIHELDDETGDVLAYPRLPTESGAGGHFEMRATDRCGNSTRVTETVRLP